MSQDLEKQKESVDNTAKMTQALQTISAIKLSRARERFSQIRPYTDNMDEMMRDIAQTGSNHPYLAGREETRAIAVCAVTSDRGLAGAFNSQVLRLAEEFIQQQNAEIKPVITGRKAVEFFKFRNIDVEASFTGFSDNPSYEDAQNVGRRLTQLFEGEEVDEVHLFHNRFQSALQQYPIHVRLLPVVPSGEEETGEEGEQEEGEEEESGGNPLEFVPGAEDLLERLVPQYMEAMMFRALVESAAGEHGSRMAAMQSATDAANDMSEELEMQINQQRQAAITQEIVEIAAAMEALGMLG